jgi:hypothetical protein
MVVEPFLSTKLLEVTDCTASLKVAVTVVFVGTRIAFGAGVSAVTAGGDVPGDAPVVNDQVVELMVLP